MTSLHLGFEEYRYPDGKTTVDVAAILEAQYHIVEYFLEFNATEIQQMMAEALYDNSVVQTADLSAVEELFRQFLDSQEIERLAVPGIPTAAAQKGSHKSMGKRRKTQIPRPSFVDLGLYRDSFRAWLEP